VLLVDNELLLLIEDAVDAVLEVDSLAPDSLLVEEVELEDGVLLELELEVLTELLEEELLVDGVLLELELLMLRLL